MAHLSGSLGLDVLGDHARRASVHPLMALPDPEVGARRLTGGGWFAVDGDPLAAEVVDALGGRAFQVDDRATYHAAACIASNHLVALMGQVERVAAAAGVPFEAYLALARGSLDDVGQLGPRGAITGPAARRDEETLARHRAVLDPVRTRGLRRAGGARRTADGTGLMETVTRIADRPGPARSSARPVVRPWASSPRWATCTPATRR